MATQNQNQVQKPVQTQAIALAQNTQTQNTIASQPAQTPIDISTEITTITNNPTLQLLLATIMLVRASTALVRTCAVAVRILRDGSNSRKKP